MNNKRRVTTYSGPAEGIIWWSGNLIVMFAVLLYNYGLLEFFSDVTLSIGVWRYLRENLIAEH